MECLRLRVGDLDFDRRSIRFYSGKGGKDRMTVFPDSLQAELRAHITIVRDIFKRRRVGSRPLYQTPGTGACKIKPIPAALR